jgi:hypothetical protein
MKVRGSSSIIIVIVMPIVIAHRSCPLSESQCLRVSHGYPIRYMPLMYPYPYAHPYIHKEQSAYGGATGTRYTYIGAYIGAYTQERGVAL